MGLKRVYHNRRTGFLGAKKRVRTEIVKGTEERDEIHWECLRGGVGSAARFSGNAELKFWMLS